MPLGRLATWMSAAAVLAACGGQSAKDPAKRHVAAEAQPRQIAPSAVAAAPRGQPAPAIARAEVEHVLEPWLRAQNQGDFAAYAQLYASAFHGVRRTRDVVEHFDHAGWLADRKRMFQKPMFVSMKQLTIASDDDFAAVDFVQSWSSGTYSDVGDKQMLLRHEKGALRIVSEEMLESRVAEGTSSPLALGLFMLVTDGELTYAVLGGPLESGFHGEPLLTLGRTKLAVARALDDEWQGRYGALTDLELVLITPERTCAARLGEPAAYRFVIPYDADDLRTAFGREDGTNPRTDPAEEAWKLGSTTFVAAPVREACEGAVLAVRAGPRAPIVLPRVALDAAAARPYLASFDRAPDGRALAARHLGYLRDISPEDTTLPASDTLDFTAYSETEHAVFRFDRNGAPALATVTFWYGGCEHGDGAVGRKWVQQPRVEQ